jgi:hypothetical protein
LEQGTVAALNFHASVECYGISTDGQVVVAAGPARAQFDPAGVVGDYAVIAVQDGDPQTLRVNFTDAQDAWDRCDNPDNEVAFPGEIVAGGFKIRMPD